MKISRRALGIAPLLFIVVWGLGCNVAIPATTTESSTTSTTISTTTTEAPAAWRQMSPDGEIPSARCDHALVYDSTSRKLLMFAGFDGSSNISETWSYEAALNLWTPLSQENEVQPSSARQMSAAYDPTTRRVITFDGTSWGYQVGDNTWSALNPGGDKLRPARYGVSMVKDENSGKVILFGGTDMNVSYQETWSYDPIVNTWTNMKPGGEVPSGRSDAGMTYDPRSGKVILFGGIDSDFNSLDDTWAYDWATNTWSRYSTSEAPSPRSGVGLAYDPHSRAIVLFGGIDSQLVCYSDTWAFDSSTGAWTQLAPSGYVPVSRARTTLAYSADIDRLVLFGGVTVQDDDTGGFGYLVYLNDVWTYGVQSDAQEAQAATRSETAVTSTTLPSGGQETTSTTP